MDIRSKASEQWQDFKKFALKGNLVDLALAVVIGGAFGNVVNSLVKNVVMPLLSYVMPDTEGYRNWKVGKVEIGLFLGEVLNFLVITGALYLVVVKIVGTIGRATSPRTPGEPADKPCPYCLSTIPFKAVKCAHCTADLGEAPAHP
jgi:large conductance mechanosensitive channel